MPRTITPEEAPSPPTVAPNRIRWTVKQCDGIRDSGVLTGRYELIDGEIISKMGHKPPHSFVVGRLNAWLGRLFGVEFVRSQTTITIDAQGDGYDEPEPDAAVTTQPDDAYADHHPGPTDLLLLIEVSDATLRFDRSTKALLYARVGIREYWVVDIPGRQVLVHRQPVGGAYSEVTAYGADEMVSPLTRPNAAKLVSDLLPRI